MRKLLRCLRGTVAFATVVALVPLIGAVSLGAEAASWYIIKQRAQNAADTAAYSGAVWLACSLASPSCTDPAADTMAFRGKEFAAQNGFCNPGDTAYPGAQCPTGTTQTVTMASLTSWNGQSGSFAQATVTQAEPTYLASVLGLTTVTIHATAVAKVQGLPHPPCVLALVGSLSFQGSPTINAPNCGVASNDAALNALNFTGGGMTMNVGSLSAVGGCTGSATFCNTALTFMPAPIVNPFSALDGALTTLCGANPTLPATCGLQNCGGTTLIAYTAGFPCTNGASGNNKGLHITSNAAENLCGVYFISNTLKITGTPTIQNSSTCTTGVTFILLPGATIQNQGNAVINITAPTTAPAAASLPASLQPEAALFQDMAFYAAPCSSCAQTFSFGGNTNVTVHGNIYAPTAAVTFQGNPVITVAGQGGCGELIAASVAFNGNATFDSGGCPTQIKLPTTQYVQLVQ